MKQSKKWIAACLLLALFLGLAACSQRDAGTAAAGGADSSGQIQTGETAPETVEIVDAGGRKVTIPGPDHLKRLYPTGSTGLILLYSLAPDMMTASPTTFDEKYEGYILPEVMNLPNYGTQSGKGTLNYEAIKAGDVQLIISANTGKITESDIAEADEMQSQLEIPVVLFSGEMDDVAETYGLLGKILGREEDAQKLTEYCQEIVDTVTAVSAQIPMEERPTLYYAEGADGLATEPASSSRSVVFNKAGARNIAEVEALSGFGQAAVSMEQVLSWNPEVIIVQGGSEAYETIISDPTWASIDAVRNGRVYKMPNLPFSWADRPPSVNRFIGLHWMANLLYPELYDIDIVEVAQEYYKVMYHVDVTREQMEAVLTDAVPNN